MASAPDPRSEKLMCAKIWYSATEIQKCCDFSDIAAVVQHFSFHGFKLP
jgi:hypothetical protein